MTRIGRSGDLVIARDRVIGKNGSKSRCCWPQGDGGAGPSGPILAAEENAAKFTDLSGWQIVGISGISEDTEYSHAGSDMEICRSRDPGRP